MAISRVQRIGGSGVVSRLCFMAAKESLSLRILTSHFL